MLHREISDRSFQVDALDGARGVAVLIVVFSHVSHRDWFLLPGLDVAGIGKSGVFLFFLLSSFLLTLPLLNKGLAIFSKKEMLHYWQRRFFRIYPLYTLFLLVVFASTLVISRLLSVQDVGIPFSLSLDELVRHLLLLDGKGVTWSIAVEFKFYFILPFVALAIWWLSQKHRAAGFIFLLAGLIISQYFFPQSETQVNDNRLMPYIPIFIMGMGLAYGQYLINQSGGLNDRYRSWSNILAWVAILIIILMTPSLFSLVAWQVPTGYFHKEFILYAVLWCLVLFSAINGRGSLSRILSHPFLRYFGMISFSMYLLHSPVIKILKYAFANFDNTSFNAWIVLLMVTMVSHISFILIEKPASKFKLV